MRWAGGGGGGDGGGDGGDGREVGGSFPLGIHPMYSEGRPEEIQFLGGQLCFPCCHRCFLSCISCLSLRHGHLCQRTVQPRTQLALHHMGVSAGPRGSKRRKRTGWIFAAVFKSVVVRRKRRCKIIKHPAYPRQHDRLSVVSQVSRGDGKGLVLGIWGGGE